MSSITFKLIEPSQASLANLISLSIGHPTPEKIHQVLCNYQQPHHFLIGSFLNHRLVGIIGLHVTQTMGVIKHLSVLQTFQGQGIGRHLIHHARRQFSLTLMQAETDRDAVTFYEKLGFRCTPFQGTYGVRFNCVWP